MPQEQREKKKNGPIRPALLSGILCVTFALGIMFSSPLLAAETLQQALVKAYQTNPGLLAEQARVRSVDEKVAEAMGGYRPSLDATANIGKRQEKTETSGNDQNQNLTPRSAGIQFVQPLFRGFRTEALVQEADQDVLIAQANLQEYEQKLLLETGQIFLSLVQERAVLTLLDNHERVLEEKLDEAIDRLAAGVSTETDVRQAEARLEKIRADRIQVQGDLDAATAAYERLLGSPPQDVQAPNLILDEPDTLEQVISLAGAKNPQIIATQHIADKTRLEIKRQKGAFLPEIDLVGSTGKSWAQSSMLPGKTEASQIMVHMRIPLYDGGRDYARTREVQERASEKNFVLETVRRDIREQAVKSWTELMTAQAAMKARQSAIKAASLALDGVLAEQQAGTRTTIDVLNAEQELLDARVDLVRARYKKDMAILQIKKVVGALTVKGLNLSADLYDPMPHYKASRTRWTGTEILR